MTAPFRSVGTPKMVGRTRNSAHTTPTNKGRLKKAPKVGKAEADNRVERSLYTRAVGHSYDAVKIFMPANRSKPVYAPYVEQVPPDVTAGIFIAQFGR
jgi:hypothetical protein